MRYLSYLFGLLFFFNVVPTQACTIFATRDTNYSYLTKSYDWGTQVGMVMANMREVHKSSLNFNATDCPDAPTESYSWISKHGSITFNQFGRDLPNGGINEHGLAVEQAEMDPTHAKNTPPSKICYVPAGATASLNTQQWIQYVLDSFQSVAELRADLQKKEYALVPYMIDDHYMVCDPEECAIIEIGRDGNLREYYIDDPGSDPSVPSSVACPVQESGQDPGEETLGCTPTIKLDDATIVSPHALTNDYYYCSVNALNQYQGFGGQAVVPNSPLFCQNPDGSTNSTCDVCRAGKGAWVDSNSVERFVSATNAIIYGNAGNGDLSVADVFGNLNKVLNAKENGGKQTSGTAWQIVYDLKNKEVHWRTMEDGVDSNGFPNATPRSLGINNVTFGNCSQNTETTLVMNIDGQGICKTSPGLACCEGPNCQLQPYKEAYNRDLVATAADKSLPQTLKNFREYINQNFPTPVDDATAKEIIYNIWGGYPRGYTACNRDVTQEDKVNLLLSSVLDPYVNPYIKDNVDKTVSYSKGKTKCTDSACTGVVAAYNGLPNPLLKPDCDNLYYTINAKVSGAQGTSLSELSVENASLMSFAGDLPKLSSSDTTIHLYCRHGSNYLWGSGDYDMGSVSVSFDMSATDFNGDVTGVETSNDITNPFCFDADLEPQVNIAKKDITLNSCHYVNIFDISIPTALCQFVLNQAKPTIFGKVQTNIKSSLKTTLLDNFPRCGVTSVATPNPLVLAVYWDMPDSQVITAYAGRTYLLKAFVGADQNSFSSEYVVFTEGSPDDPNSTIIDSSRIRAAEGSNLITALWTPKTAGDTELYVDAIPQNEQTDEVKPALLRVRVLTADSDPSPSQDVVPLADAQGGGGGSSSGCFIATAAYGSYWEPHVRTLRLFRDSYLLTNNIGKSFVNAYYRYSSPVADFIAKHEGLKSAVRVGLAPLVVFSWLALHYGFMVASAVLISMLTLLIGGAFLIIYPKKTTGNMS